MFSIFGSNVALELADIAWDNLGFGFMPTDYMYTMKCSEEEAFSDGELRRFGNIELSPSSGILNYGQVSFGVQLFDFNIPEVLYLVLEFVVAQQMHKFK